ncbi:MAG: Fe-S cluster assembly protein SufD [SAR202 cluster bacterium]|nr:Fe-S cluster assembly protein SufD [SAR202 cluster bacterium]
MTQTLEKYDKYRADFAVFERALPSNGASKLGELRKHAFARFTELGFPTATRGNEKWRFTNIGPLAAATFVYPQAAPRVTAKQLASVATYAAKGLRMVFINGKFSAGLSDLSSATGDLTIKNLADAAHDNGKAVDSVLGSLAPVEHNGFTAINTAFVRDGAFIQIKPDTEVKEPLNLVFLSTAGPEAFVAYPRVLVIAGRHSKITVIESYVSLGDGTYFTNGVGEFVAEDGAKIDHYRFLQESENAYHIGNTAVRLERDSTFKSTSIARGARIARNEVHLLHNAPGSASALYGLYATNGAQQIDNHINIDHAVPHTTSDIFFKGILDGNSRAVFSGGVLVRKDAQKTIATQSDKNLILSSGARINTKPSLEIFADDVKCAHGATAGAVAEDILFYAQSRGLDRETAQKILIYGFSSEIIQKIEPEAFRRHVDAIFSGGMELHE